MTIPRRRVEIVVRPKPHVVQLLRFFLQAARFQLSYLRTIGIAVRSSGFELRSHFVLPTYVRRDIHPSPPRIRMPHVVLREE